MEGRRGGLGLGTVIAGAVRTAGRALFPHCCVACGREGAILCAACEHDIIPPLRGVFVCPGCGEPSPLGVRCQRRACRACPIDAAVAAAPYAHPALRAVLAAWKFERVDEAGLAVRRCIAAFAARHAGALRAAAGDDAVVVPAPMHPVRAAIRGFDQATLLAGTFARTLGLPLENGALVRRWRWFTQSSLRSTEERAANVRGSVVARRPASGKAVIVVDDVMTSGATFRECAIALKRAGASRVVAAAFLRG